ncbi:MAG: hypothetical protein DLM72_08215 [Candidatus Nitrosopolaris wilkensis]|nr:MAG: hypothetical protein DLM72_08215 [Candidatus Nitrosopolaris wilkensis]
MQETDKDQINQQNVRSLFYNAEYPKMYAAISNLLKDGSDYMEIILQLFVSDTYINIRIT